MHPFGDNDIDAVAAAILLSMKISQTSYQFIPSPHRDFANPTYKRTTCSTQKTNLRRYASAALSAATNTVVPTTNFFHLTSIALHDFHITLQQHIINWCRYLQHVHQSHEPLQHDELMWEHVILPPIDGFSPLAPQVYATSGIGYTAIHDELLHSSAFNYMVSNTQNVVCAVL